MESTKPYIRVWCEPCDLRITFPSLEIAVHHANVHHQSVVWYTDADGHYIGEPKPTHTPTPVITRDELLDLWEERTSWDAAYRTVVALAAQ